MAARCSKMSAVARVSALVASWGRRPMSYQVSAVCNKVEPAVNEVSKQRSPPHLQNSVDPVAPRTLADLNDDQLLHLLNVGAISPHTLETSIGNSTRAVHLRRALTAAQLANSPPQLQTSQDPVKAFQGLPVESFDTAAFYDSILNTNCEAVIGYVPLPVGIIGPLRVDGKDFRVPMATTEGALLASTNRGCAAIRKAGGCTTALLSDGMSRAPLVSMPSMKDAADLKEWLEKPENFEKVAEAFNSTTRFGRLQSLKVATAGRNVYIRLKAKTGDAMGMNMITKGTHKSLELITSNFPQAKVLSLSGNFCTDKKPSAVNWIEGRGKSVSAEVKLSGYVLKTVLKTDAHSMAALNTTKNLVGSALAGSIGGFNAHASNILTAVFLATGQDGAQNVESSTCMTLMEVDDSITDPNDPEGKYGPGIIMSVNMPSIEVGTIGGGTTLPAQSACLEILGLKGSHPTNPGQNAATLARVVAASVLAGELSLMSALTTNDLLNSHMKLNRKPSDDQNSARGAPITPAIQARLQELTLKKDASQRTAGSPINPTGNVSGGAPLGAHGHPLNLSPSSLYGTTSSPGRRYFAAPSTSRNITTNLYGFKPVPLGFQKASPEANNTDNSEPRLSVP